MIGARLQQAAEESAPTLLGELPAHQKVVAVVVAVAILLAVLELVRRRKLREEYSLLWIVTSFVLLALALQPRLLGWFQLAIGAQTAPSALFFGALAFLMLVSLLVSLRLSRLTFRSRALSQRVALQQQEIDALERRIDQLQRRLGPADDGAAEGSKKRARGGAA